MKTIIGGIAAGHSDTAKAAENVLREGGNAFDAVIAAQLTGCVAGPVPTSLAGSGFLMDVNQIGFIEVLVIRTKSSRIRYGLLLSLR